MAIFVFERYSSINDLRVQRPLQIFKFSIIIISVNLSQPPLIWRYSLNDVMYNEKIYKNIETS